MLDLDQHIWQLLDLDLLDAALFSAEQYYTLKPSDESKYLHGLALYRLARYKSAFKILDGEKYLPSAYLFAQCALKLEKPGKGIDVLNGAKPWLPIPSQRGCPSLAALNLLLGKLQGLDGDRSNSAITLAQSCKQDVFLVENVTSLLGMQGYKLDINTLFTEQQKEEPMGALGLASAMRSPIAGPRTPLLINRRTSSHANNHGTPLRVSSGQFQQQMDTPLHVPPPRSYRNITPTPLKTPEHPPLPMAPRRPKFRRPLDGDDTFLSPSTLFDHEVPAPIVERPHGTEGDVTIQDIFRSYYIALQFINRYESRQCLAELEKLPEQHQNTPTLLAVAARCHYELQDYKKSEEAYARLHETDPFRTQNMELYSTVLWQMKEKSKLGLLAHEMVSSDREAWQTWCVIGNSFSLQNDTTNAIECFTRATQLNPKCAVAYALQGHEYLLNEELRTAIDAFQSALHADPLAYNAYFGLAMVYFRLEDIDSAERYVTQALRINPNNPGMLSFMGIIYDQKGQSNVSISLYKRARMMQPECYPARYETACALIRQEKYDEALTELKSLQDSDPEAADVQFTLGKVYRLLQNNQLAVKYLTTAMSLDPRLATQVKQQLSYIGD